jgi:hypothetical protein
MHPKIDKDQHLGPPFELTGPVDDGTGGYDDDLAMAITFVITQDQGGGDVAKGVGKSKKVYMRGGPDAKWTGTVRQADSTAFEPGPAVVSAFAALINDDGEWELYPWGRTVNLINP